MTQPIRALCNKHAGETAYIIGKGPSLVNLRRETLGPGPVIVLNEALRKVLTLGLSNVVYSMQKDGAMLNPPDGVPLLVHVHESAEAFTDHRPRYLFDNPVDFGLSWCTPSIVTALKIAELMGCAGIAFVCMDAATTGDCRTVEDGLASISGDEQPSYMVNAEILYRNLATSPIKCVEWITP